MSLRALIFDVDGTLADTEEFHRRAFNAAFAAQGLRWFWGRRVYGELLKVAGGRERIAFFIDAMDVSNPEKKKLLSRVAAIHADKTRIYTELVVAGDVKLRAGVSTLLKEARLANLKLAIATTTTRANIDALLAHTLGQHSLQWFSAIGAAEAGVPKKPCPDIYFQVLAELELGADEVVAFEDSANGVAAAKGAGIFTVVVPTAWTKGEDLRRADLRLDGFHGLRGLRSLEALHGPAVKASREAA
jgi:beta-phosphoglucomutase-like phosphatase (HAD superfamily)